MNSSEWVSVISTTYEYIYGLSVFIYPVWWGFKIAKKVGIIGR